MSGKTKLEGKNNKIALKMLAMVTGILEKYEIPYILEGGTLLGVIRENRLLPWDDDIDLTITEKYKKDILRRLWSIRFKGYRVRVKKYLQDVGPFQKNELRIIKIRNYKFLIFRGKITVDIFIKRHIGTDYYWTVGIKKPVIKSVPDYFYENLKTYEFNGKNYSIPEEYEEYLEYRYGNWMIPQKTWDFKRDDRAIID